MANTCYDTDLLQYSGTSQLERALQALLSQYARVDERTTAQLILFAKKYGAYLNYYDATNQFTGDWQNFMASDVSVIIAAIADWKIKDITPFITNVKDEVLDAANSGEAKKHFKTIFDLVFTLAMQLDAGVKHLPDDVRFSNFLSVAITSNLALPLALLYNYYISFRDAPLSLVDESLQYIDPLMPVSPVFFSGSFHPSELSKFWDITSPDVPQITLQGADVKDDISHVLTHNLFTGPLQLFINGIINIISKTPAYLEETLNNYPAHQPHYALYLAFLRLFRYAQNHLNKFTQNHLDFYYKDVLQLKNRNAEPGFVHLLFELQKSAEPYLLSKETTFKAGKDAANNDLFYSVVNDVVLQKTTVQSLQSLYLSKEANAVLYASPIADSDDGNGGKLTSADNSWFAFGNPKKITAASIGFAVASNVLFLHEGKRSIAFVFDCDNLSGITENDLADIFTIQFTTKKNWYTAASYTVAIDGSSFTLQVDITGDVPPVVPYSEKIHNGKLNTTLPVAQFLVNNYSSYQKIKKIQMNRLTVKVSAAVKNISLQSKDGKINAAKPFKPFGDFPDKNASFIIGSEEIFQKHLTELTIDIDWQSPDMALALDVAYNELAKSESVYQEASTSFQSITSNISTPLFALAKTSPGNGFEISEKSDNLFNSEFFKLAADKLTAPVNLFVLSAGDWQPTAIATSTNITGSDITLDDLKAGNIPFTEAEFNGNTDYTIDAVSGFIKLQLDTDNYSLATYLSNTQKAFEPTSVEVTTNGNKATYTVPPPKLVSPAPQLIANGISIEYSAKDEIDFTDNTEESFINSTVFYHHIEPFGTREMHSLLTDDNITLLPVFNLDNNSSNTDGGELWIGLKDAFPSETLSMLFEVSDGSSNPLKNMTELKWYYLANNNWLPFDKSSVIDETNNLTRSGIVTITLPDNATVGNTRADALCIWIKLVTDHDTDAVCKLISIRTNAAKASFVQDLSKGIEYKTALPANIISKPVVPIAAIKKTEQPYASFGGRLHETDERFYIRVSERLRHKHRAVTAWDYERLVLDYFPQVHKTKCINHTGFIINQNTGETKYSEVLPGHVMLVTVPDLTNRLYANLLRPYTSVGLIEEIQQYLEKLTSPFVKLHVTNPQFEEVQFDFEVSFLPNHDAVFYTTLLNDEIEKFLTPWAYESGRDIEFGGKIEKSVVLNFVEEREYVDYVTCFKMNHFIRDENNSIVKKNYNIEEAVASTARSILVSYYDETTLVKHLIQSPANCNCNG